MPREVSHWHYGTEALKKVRSLYSLMSQSKELEAAFMLGAITHDSAYFNLSPKESGNNVAEFLHGKSGEDTFLLPRMLLSSVKNLDMPRRRLVQFFSLGLLSHILLDSGAHPLIYQITGDYYHKELSERTKARIAHRNLETILEFHVMKNIGSPYSDWSIIKLLNNLPTNSKYFLSWIISENLNKTNSGLKLTNESFMTFWKYHALTHYLFSSKYSSNLVRKLPLLPKSIRVLAHYPLHELTNSLEKSFLIDNKKNSILSACNSGLTEMQTLFERLEECLHNPGKPELPLEIWGPSLNTGIPKKGLPSGPFEPYSGFYVIT
ncbi:MAG TPA: zinc dependent phospholipase C family protein [Oligoflexia bacterium]|nr:zinc dependent phospholipase C family protein [Oligoflexia bacterium]HMP48577.1 zinc dependent phospholipase C family protein [Oligoflexia bacterium]